MKSIEDIKNELQTALGNHAGNVTVWLTSIEDPYKAVMMFDKIAATYLKLTELELTGKAEDGFSVTIQVNNEEEKATLERLQVLTTEVKTIK